MDEKIMVQADTSWEYALAILGHELRKRGRVRRLVLEFNKGGAHKDYWDKDGNHTSENIPMFYICELDN